MLAGYSTYLLGTWVRERKAMTLETAVQRLTSTLRTSLALRTGDAWRRASRQTSWSSILRRSAPRTKPKSSTIFRAAPCASLQGQPASTIRSSTAR